MNNLTDLFNVTMTQTERSVEAQSTLDEHEAQCRAKISACIKEREAGIVHFEHVETDNGLF